MPFGSSDYENDQRGRIKELETKLAEKELEVKRLWGMVDFYQEQVKELKMTIVALSAQ
jgi:hypothetical protein